MTERIFARLRAMPRTLLPLVPVTLAIAVGVSLLSMVHVAVQTASLVRRIPHGDETINVRDLALSRPGGERLVSGISIDLRPGEWLLVTGPTGTGKSTLLRALAGIWPFGRGVIEVPGNARMLFLPQRPYLPVGSLRAAISYPSSAAAFDDRALRDTLAACGLHDLAGRLDEAAHRTQQLSPGEQQRIGFARALLHAPDWLFLDEATAALDKATEARLYALLKERLPKACVVSVAHRSTLAAFHERRLDLVLDREGVRAAEQGDAHVIRGSLASARRERSIAAASS